MLRSGSFHAWSSEVQEDYLSKSKILEEEAFFFKSQKSELEFFCSQELQADHILRQCIVALGSQHLRLERPLQCLELKLMWQESVKTL
ncbi:hypothetical protein V8E51_004066 [Hyaloscypha variabilis]